MLRPRWIRSWLLGISSLILGGCGGDSPRVTIAAAASLRPWLDSERAELQSLAPGLQISFDASSRLRAQIQAGASFSIFLSADRAEVDSLAKANLAEAPVAILHNHLALVGTTQGPRSLEELAATAGRIAVAGPGVPAGKLARTRLASLGWLSQLEPRLVSADHVRAALNLVQQGAVPFAFVYTTDARVAPGLSLIWEDDPRFGSDVVAALLTPATEASRRLFRHLTADATLERAYALGFGKIPVR